MYFVKFSDALRGKHTKLKKRRLRVSPVEKQWRSTKKWRTGKRDF